MIVIFFLSHRSNPEICHSLRHLAIRNQYLVAHRPDVPSCAQWRGLETSIVEQASSRGPPGTGRHQAEEPGAAPHHARGPDAVSRPASRRLMRSSWKGSAAEWPLRASLRPTILPRTRTRKPRAYERAPRATDLPAANRRPVNPFFPPSPSPRPRRFETAARYRRGSRRTESEIPREISAPIKPII